MQYENLYIYRDVWNIILKYIPQFKSRSDIMLHIDLFKKIILDEAYKIIHKIKLKQKIYNNDIILQRHFKHKINHIFFNNYIWIKKITNNYNYDMFYKIQTIEIEFQYNNMLFTLNDY